MKINSDIKYILDNPITLSNYLFDKFPDSFEDREHFEEFLLNYENYKFTKTILDDYQKDNFYKINRFIERFGFESLIISVIADRGQGKTAFSIWLLDEIKKKFPQKKIYALYPFPKLPFIDKIVFDITQVPDNSILYIDELGKKYKARESLNSDAVALTDELIGLRHRQISVIGSTQDLSLVDINYIRLSDLIVWKYYNLQKQELTREGFINNFVKFMLPKKNEINNVLISENGSYSTFRFEFSPYSKDVSCYLSDVKKQKYEIIEYLQEYYEKKELIKVLYTQYGFKLTIKEQKELIK